MPTTTTIVVIGYRQVVAGEIVGTGTTTIMMEVVVVTTEIEIEVTGGAAGEGRAAVSVGPDRGIKAAGTRIGAPLVVGRRALTGGATGTGTISTAEGIDRGIGPAGPDLRTNGGRRIGIAVPCFAR
jgi:hypothetical protein